jgi:alpha-glucoside transport system substrate-binding protein
MKLKFSLTVFVIIALAGIACEGGQPIPTPATQPAIDRDELRSLVQEAVQQSIPAAQPQISREELQQIIEQVVASSAPEGASPEQIREMVENAVESASSSTVSREEIEELVSNAVQEAVSQTQQGLTPEEIEQIVSGAIQALPTPAASETIDTVSVMHQWVSGGEPESFEAVVTPWEVATGGQVNDTGTRDIKAILVTRVEGGNPPDIAALSAPGDMEAFARQGALVPLDSFLDMSKIREEYSQAWIDLCTVEGRLYCLVYKAANKSTVWYDPEQFELNEWETPTTWDEMVSLSDQIVADGQTPWSMGVESGGASGWPGTDWIGQIVLSESGPEIYDQWVNHEIAWTDPAIKSAFEKFGDIVLSSGYVPGGPTFALSTNFTDASYLPFRDPPQSYMYFLGSFTQGFIEEEFPAAEIGVDYSFFPFPAIDPEFDGAVTGGADLVVMFNDTPGARSLMGYLASAGAQQIWVSRGGFTSTNGNVSLSAYPDSIAGKVADQLTNARIFRFDADDIWGGSLQQAFWNGILNYLQNPDQLDTILSDIEAAAVEQLGPVGQGT